MNKTELNRRLKDHKKWLGTDGKEGRRADLQGADLQGAYLQGADFDFSGLPLWCGSFTMIVDDRFVCQLLFHFYKLDVSRCSPVVRYAHRLICHTWPGKWLIGKFTEYREGVSL